MTTPEQNEIPGPDTTSLDLIGSQPGVLARVSGVLSGLRRRKDTTAEALEEAKATAARLIEEAAEEAGSAEEALEVVEAIFTTFEELLNDMDRSAQQVQGSVTRFRNVLKERRDTLRKVMNPDG